MNDLKPIFRGIVALLILCILSPSSAQAAEHVIVIELEFDDAPAGTCSVATVVVVSAVDCDGSTLGSEIASALTQAGISNFGCPLIGSGSFPDWFQCAWNIPSGCVQVNERATVELGSDCTDSRLAGMVIEPMVSNRSGFFYRLIP